MANLLFYIGQSYIFIPNLGVDDLHNFVSVALHTTAGEDDYDSDRLSNLKKIGNTFGSLIYDLKDDKSFETFRIGCFNAWYAMVNTKENLPKILVKFIVVSDFGM